MNVKKNVQKLKRKISAQLDYIRSIRTFSINDGTTNPLFSYPSTSTTSIGSSLSQQSMNFNLKQRISKLSKWKNETLFQKNLKEKVEEALKAHSELIDEDTLSKNGNAKITTYINTIHAIITEINTEIDIKLENKENSNKKDEIRKRITKDLSIGIYQVVKSKDINIETVAKLIFSINSSILNTKSLSYTNNEPKLLKDIVTQPQDSIYDQPQNGEEKKSTKKPSKKIIKKLLDILLKESLETHIDKLNNLNEENTSDEGTLCNTTMLSYQ